MRKLIRLTYFVCKKWEGKEKHYIWWATKSYQEREQQQGVNVCIYLEYPKLNDNSYAMHCILIYRCILVISDNQDDTWNHSWHHHLVQYQSLLFLHQYIRTIFMPENFRSCVSLILKILSQVSFEKMNKMC